MSVSKWNYSPEKCDGDFCIGDCDLCPKQEQLLTETDDRRESMLYRYAKWFGDIVPRDRRIAIADDPECIEVDYLSIAIIKPKPRKREDFEGKPLGKRATRKLLRQIREEITGQI